MRRRTLSRLAIAACALSLVAGIAPAASASGGPASPAHSSGSAAYKRVGYFTQWGIYGRDFQVKDLDTSGAAAKLTHINYAFGNVSADGKCFTGNVPGEADAWADYVRPLDAAGSVDGVADTDAQPLAGNFNQLRELKAKHPGLKVMISLGGWSWSTHFSDAARTAASRKAFVSSCIDLYFKGNLPVDGARGGEGAAAGLFDGVDIDWEWPGSMATRTRSTAPRTSGTSPRWCTSSAPSSTRTRRAPPRRARDAGTAAGPSTTSCRRSSPPLRPRSTQASTSAGSCGTSTS